VHAPASSGETALPPPPARPEDGDFTSFSRVARLWAVHLLCFVLPLAVLAFFATAPHPSYLALPWLLVLAGNVVADVCSRTERRQPPPALPGWPFDGVLHVLVGLQLLNVVLLVRLVALGGVSRLDVPVACLLMGVTSAYSGIVVGHELIHRPRRHMQLLGRALLCTVLYEHFFTEHIRGHHARVGTEDDPATARYGETALRFFLRTVPAQFRSAWRLEAKRLGDEYMRSWDRRLLRSRVVHGVVAEATLLLAILTCGGPGALVVFVLQAVLAVWFLEVVNYFEHWGLVRTGKRVRTIDAWDTDSWFTYYTLVGLSRHAHHHMLATCPYQQLRFLEGSPKLPYGYFATAVLAMFRNRRFRELMAVELGRRSLGPFAPAAGTAA
jgi:alkane 1-monooxygenase